MLLLEILSQKESTATQTIDNDLSYATLLKSVSKDIITVVFGTHVTALAEECFNKCSDLDVIIKGEPEVTANELATAIDRDMEIKEIEGIAYRSRDMIIQNEERESLENYRLPLNNKKLLMVLPCRGCPFNCVYCTTHSYYGNRLRRHSVKRVVSEIKHNIERYKINDFFFWSDTFTVDKHFVRDLCNAFIKERLDISWNCTSRVDTVDFDTLKLMKEAGCWLVSFGLESGSQDVLDSCKKGIKLKQITETVGSAKKAGLNVAGHFILGLPGDNCSTVEETIEFSNTLSLDFVQYYCCVPFPGSNLYEIAKEKQWVGNNSWDGYRQDYSIMQIPGIKSSDVNQYRKMAYRRFYRNPMNWINKLKLVNKAGVLSALKTLKRFTMWS
jgi:radical SAM superfamily enzyme YgiQ (UPF0313 family)